MNFNTNLKIFLNSALLNDFGQLDFSLPNPSINQYIEQKAAEFTNSSHMLSDDDLVQFWGSFEKFYSWKAGIVKQALTENKFYILGRIDSLIRIWNQYQLSVNQVDPDDLEKLDIEDYLNQIREIVDDEEY